MFPKHSFLVQFNIFLLQSREVRGLVSTELFEKYLSKSLIKAEASLMTFHCKSLNCSGFCEYDNGTPYFICYLCHKTNCIPCDVKYVLLILILILIWKNIKNIFQACHDSQTCDQYQTLEALVTTTDSSLSKEKIVEEMARGLVKKCPQCNVLIQRNGGCNYMICTCGYHFNWGYWWYDGDSDEEV